MVFASLVVEKLRLMMFYLSQSIARWCWVLVQLWGAVVSFSV